jgi:hypothetical protein
MAVNEAELWATGPAIQDSVKKYYTQQTHEVMKLAVFSDLPVAVGPRLSGRLTISLSTTATDLKAKLVARDPSKYTV